MNAEEDPRDRWLELYERSRLISAMLVIREKVTPQEIRVSLEIRGLKKDLNLFLEDLPTLLKLAYHIQLVRREVTDYE